MAVEPQQETAKEKQKREVLSSSGAAGDSLKQLIGLQGELTVSGIQKLVNQTVKLSVERGEWKHQINPGTIR